MGRTSGKASLALPSGFDYQELPLSTSSLITPLLVWSLTAEGSAVPWGSFSRNSGDLRRKKRDWRWGGGRSLLPPTGSAWCWPPQPSQACLPETPSGHWCPREPSVQTVSREFPPLHPPPPWTPHLSDGASESTRGLHSDGGIPEAVAEFLTVSRSPGSPGTHRLSTARE